MQDAADWFHRYNSFVASSTKRKQLYVGVGHNDVAMCIWRNDQEMRTHRGVSWFQRLVTLYFVPSLNRVPSVPPNVQPSS